jgi:hypothetical protein
MTQFNGLHHVFCGGSCATSAGVSNPPGVGIRFDRAYLDSEEDSVYYKNVTVPTSRGNIYLKLRYGKSHGTPARLVPDSDQFNWVVPKDIEHYSIKELIDSKDLSNLATVCIGLYVDHSETYKKYVETATHPADKKMYEEYEKMYIRQKEFLESPALADKLIFKSDQFHNSIHPSRAKPICVLYIFDKEMKK